MDIPQLRRLVLLGLGWAFVILGIAGLFLPILQGLLFLVIGLSLLAMVSPRARLLRLRLGRRYPVLRRTHDGAVDWLRRMRRRFGRGAESPE